MQNIQLQKDENFELNDCLRPEIQLAILIISIILLKKKYKCQKEAQLDVARSLSYFKTRKRKNFKEKNNQCFWCFCWIRFQLIFTSIYINII